MEHTNLMKGEPQAGYTVLCMEPVAHLPAEPREIGELEFEQQCPATSAGFCLKRTGKIRDTGKPGIPG